MPKSLVLGNGNILVGFDNRGQVRDFYYPYVGLENQAGSSFIHRIGVWANDQLYWLDDPSWEVHVNYQEETLVSHIEAINPGLNLKIDFSDIVYNEKNIFIRHAVVQNLGDSPLQIKIFFHQEFEIYESHRGDTAYYDPSDNVIVHYKGRRVFLVNALCDDKSFNDYSVGLFKVEGKEGTYRDAEDGVLSKNSVEHGLVDSVIGLTVTIEPQSSKDVYYWIAAAKFIKEANELNEYVLERTPKYLIGTTRDFWNAWINKQPFKFHDLDVNIVRQFKKSLLIMRTHVDNRGAILASGDSDILFHGRDTYAYFWPRDGAFIAMVLDRAGDSQVVKKLFEFCNQVITDEGYMMHRYRADQSLGSSWHPFVRDGKAELPIQEDETALIICALWKHYNLTKDLEFIESIYNSLIKIAAEFMLSHRDNNTGLPKPSYDLWEEKFGISTFTASTVYAGLVAASKFAGLLGKADAEKSYLDAARQVQTAILKHLYDETEGYFYKMINFKNGVVEIDKTVDSSSVYGIWRFGVLSPSDEKVVKAVKKTEEALYVGRAIGGIARYEGDKYFTAIPETTGNPWFITTLWLGQYSLLNAQSAADLQKVKDSLNWAVKYSLPSGMMSEQLHPETGAPISATPLIWSHAEFVITVLNYLEKLDHLGICKDCNPITVDNLL